MANNSITLGGKNEWSIRVFQAFAVLILASIFAGIATDAYYLAGLPLLVVFAFLAIVDFRKLFFFLLGLLPFSTEVSLPGGLGTDLPSEPLMVALMFFYLAHVLKNIKTINADFIRHPISLLLLLHLGWTFATSIVSELFYVSLKFSLARVWYITVFYFMAGSMIKTIDDFKKVFWWVFIPLTFTIIVVLVRYSAYGFAFDDVNAVMSPFYRNHITYASIMVLFFPFVWFARKWYPKKSNTGILLTLSLLLFLAGIQFSYSRLAYLCLIAAFGAYFIIKYKYTKLAVALSIIGALLIVRIALKNNNFLEMAPDFEKTVTHHEFDNLIEATYKLEDISGMERVYRWVAAIYMTQVRPWTGVGPGNFYNYYRGYTLNKFKTYISDNIEKSGIHCYYLMVLVEQGFPGLIIFCFFVFYPLLRGETIYHQAEDPLTKDLVMMLLLSLIIVLVLLLLNDLLESDKVGPFFLMAMAILVNIDLANQRRIESQTKGVPATT